MKHSRIRNSGLVFVLLALSCCQPKQNTYEELVTIAQPMEKNIYLAGGSVRIQAPVRGDVIAMGGTILISDSVRYDVLAVGGKIEIQGNIGGDLRSAGGEIYIDRPVEGDVVVAGGTLRLGPNARVGGDVLISGGTVTLDGVVEGEVKAMGGIIYLNGTIERGLTARGEQLEINGQVKGASELAASKMIVGDEAQFEGPVRYWTEEEPLDFQGSLRGTTATFDDSLALETARWHLLGFGTVVALFWYLGTVLIMILLLEYIFGHVFREAARVALNQTAKSLGLGLLYVVVVPVAILLVFFTIVGIPLGIIALFIYVMTLLFSLTIASLVVTHWFENYLKAHWTFARASFTALGFFIAIKILSLVPVFGWLIVTIVALLAFGAILATINRAKLKSALRESTGAPS